MVAYSGAVREGGRFMSEQECRELNNAPASARMDGFEVAEQTERDCIRLLSGEVSVWLSSRC